MAPPLQSPARPLPKRSELVDFKGAVAGHAGTLCDTDGMLFIKPCTQAEIAFYEAARAGHLALADLMPLYMGTLMLHEAASPTAAMTAAAATAAADPETWVPRGGQTIATDRAVVLENATHGYRKPNVLDIKLGQRLWADDAPLQKRIRMDEVRAQTTHDQLGFRIAGMRVYGGPNPVQKSTDASALPTPTPDSSGYRVYDKNFGRYSVNECNVIDALRRFLFVEEAGVDTDHARALARAFKAALERVCAVLEQERTRMFSSSLLFVYEGDGATLRAAVAQGNAVASEQEAQKQRASNDDGPERESWQRTSRSTRGPTSDRASSRTDSGIAMDEEEEEEEETYKGKGRSGSDTFVLGSPDDFVDEGTEEGDEEEDEDDEDDEEASLPPICGLRLIDFAHAQFVPEAAGPDENTLVGIRSLIRLFDELAQ